MDEFRNYFKFPLRMWDSLAIKAFTADNNMAFDWLLPCSDAYQQVKETLLDKINGKDTKPFKTKKTFYHEDGIIYAKMEEGKNKGETVKILRIRGWGMLTGTGGYQLPPEKAAEIQDAFAEYCVNKLNQLNNDVV